jgi:Flp pilus assembly protein protease CpaA
MRVAGYVVAALFFAAGCLFVVSAVQTHNLNKTDVHELGEIVVVGIAVACFGFSWIGTLLTVKR